MFNLRLLTSQTRINKLRYILLHTLPPKHFPQVLIHFSSTGMNTQTTFMPFLKNSLSQIHDIRNTNSIATSHNIWRLCKNKFNSEPKYRIKNIIKTEYS